MSISASFKSIHARISRVLTADEAPRAAALALHKEGASADGSSSSLSPSSTVSTASTVVDALWLADCEISVMQEGDTVAEGTSGAGDRDDTGAPSAPESIRWAEARARAPRLALLVTELVKCGAVDMEICLRRLSPALLAGSGLVGDARVVSKMLLRANTRKLYVQQKFNLLHEDAEGYSKLFTELSSAAALMSFSIASSSSSSSASACPPPSLSVSAVNSLASRVTSLIGHFNLDPNRVVDMILEALELNIAHHMAYLPLLRLFRKDRLCHILGRKFHGHQISSLSSSSSSRGGGSASKDKPTENSDDHDHGGSGNENTNEDEGDAGGNSKTASKEKAPPPTAPAPGTEPPPEEDQSCRRQAPRQLVLL